MPIKVQEIEAKSLLRKNKRVDSWFLSAYGMNIYRGCQHDCIYCDGRAEKYRVDGDFGCQVSVKINALDLLKKELNPKRKRTPFRRGYICIGGGVGDSYQPIEEKYRLTRQILEFLCQKNFPIHILTKSRLVLRDLDFLKELNKKNHVIVSFSLSSARDDLGGQWEPGASLPSQRLEAVRILKNAGIAVGIFLLPVIPYITDSLNIISDSLDKARNAGADFVMFGGMTLKQGRQMDFFYEYLKKLYPQLMEQYTNIYTLNHPGCRWGNAIDRYYRDIQQNFNRAVHKYPLPQRIPPRFYLDLLEENDRVMVMLEHIDYYLKARGRKSPCGYAAYSISRLKEPISSIKDNLCSLPGVGPFTENIILDILNNGKSTLLEELANYYDKNRYV